mgnify:CR=1 FL=1
MMHCNVKGVITMCIETNVKYVIFLLMIGQCFSLFFCVEKNNDFGIYDAIGVIGSLTCTLISVIFLDKWLL